MSNLEDAVNEAVPDNNYVKPLMIAAGALILGHLFGKKEEAPANPSNPALPPAQGLPQQQPGAPQQQGGGGIVGSIMNSLSNSPFGGLIAGGAAGTAVSGGLDMLLNQFRGAGHEQQVNSWVATGENRPISPDQINKVLGQGKIAEIAAQAGISPEQMSQLLAQALPTLVDKLTPGGRLPTQG